MPVNHRPKPSDAAFTRYSRFRDCCYGPERLAAMDRRELTDYLMCKVSFPAHSPEWTALLDPKVIDTTHYALAMLAHNLAAALSRAKESHADSPDDPRYLDYKDKTHGLLTKIHGWLTTIRRVTVERGPTLRERRVLREIVSTLATAIDQHRSTVTATIGEDEEPLDGDLRLWQALDDVWWRPLLDGSHTAARIVDVVTNGWWETRTATEPDV